jgi:hypothetical protein
MTFIATKICEYIRPDSVTDSEAEAYEYFLVWLGVDGGCYCWMFEDYTLKKSITGQVINTRSENISKLINSANRSIELIAEDLSENEFDIISDITRALVVRRYYTDGTYDNLAIETTSYTKNKSDFRYDFRITVSEVQDQIMR